MKLLPILGFFGLLLCFASCKKNDDNNPAPVNPTTVSTALSSGDWKVTYYFDRDHEETNNYTGFTFKFGANNVLTAIGSTASQTGTWATGTDDSKTKLVIAFSVDILEELSEDWEVLESTSTKIRLQHVSGGDGHTDLLTFERK